jgi:hypothetical protein
MNKINFWLLFSAISLLVLSGYYKYQYEKTKTKVDPMYSIINNIFPIGTPTPTVESYEIPTMNPTVEAETDEMVYNWLVEEGRRETAKMYGNGRDFYKEIKTGKKKCLDIYDEQKALDMTSKPIDKVKAIRAKITIQIDSFYDIWHNEHPYERESNDEEYMEFRDNITIVNERQRLLESQCGIHWDTDKKQYKE